MDVYMVGRVAELIQRRNNIDAELAKHVGRPASVGHLGEWIASHIFGINLESSAAARAIDGCFADGPLVGCTVNIKWYLKREGLVDLSGVDGPAFYLVMTGPSSAVMSSRGGVRPMAIDGVYLFDGEQLVSDLRSRKIKVGTASSVRTAMWDEAEIYPRASARLPMTSQQRECLALLGSSAVVSPAGAGGALV